MNFSTLKKQAGMTLTESLLVLAVGALVAVLAYGGYRMATTQVNSSSQVKGLVQMVGGIKRIFNASGNYNGITTPIVVNAGIVPDDFRKTTGATGTITNSWGGTITVAPTKLAAAAPIPAYGTADNQGFAIVINGIPADSCMDIVTGVASAANVIQGGAAGAAATNAKALNGTVDIAAANTGCIAGGTAATVVVISQ